MLEIKNLKKRYGNFELDCSFHIDNDQVIGLVGRNGVGKTTIFRSILGLLRPDSGEVHLFGKPVSQLSANDKGRIGVTFPNSFISEGFTITDVKKTLSATYSATFNISEFEQKCEQQKLPVDKKVKHFSTGIQAKLKLLLALSHEADFLLLDQPTSGLDVIVRKELLAMLQAYLGQKHNRSVLISSHISSDLEQICDFIILIDDGKIILQEETDHLLNNYGILKVPAEEYPSLDKEFILATKKRKYGYACLTNERRYYQENNPKLAVEKASVDDVLELLIKEEK
ncbi:ATP-binding cassette domain-containing protein [Paenibacillus herberti]|uniref:ABC transporter ATP-binding protein n=1 Tax=Paenibacillus herberti TaxID=1619309 RepID=A0A229P4N9_9BACL|nr:ABC transporter ATP-binding protein [Paenibacillus herberti]OXM17021.1 ABC transporter ATP-binding protein [Paenibacillus herberti]